MLPVATALLTALVLFAAQHFHFEIIDARENAAEQAESLLDLARAARGLDDESVIVALTHASQHFEELMAARYCRAGHCLAIATRQSGEHCNVGESWDSLCASARSGDESVEIRYSLAEAHLESVRNVLVLAAILALATAIAWAGSRRLRHRVASAEQLLRHAATHDTLTGLSNRSEFEARASRFIAQRRRGALLFLDLDGFKEINDHYGHHVGDRMLCEAARRIRAVLAHRDEVGRLGGDEFGILVPCGAELGLADHTARTLIQALSEPVVIDGCSMKLGASIGIAVLDRDAIRFDEALRRADVALYEVKRGGRGCALYFDPVMDEAARTLYELQNELKFAIGGDQLFLEYQPQVAGNGELRGVEALVRWRHPSRGLIRPDQFIGMAEKSGLIGPLGLRVAEIACADLMRLRAAGLKLPYVGINVSTRQLDDTELANTLCSIVQSHGLTPHDIELEITESSLMESARGELAIQRFADAGFRVAIDDFGTGYSSLSRLQSLPVGKLKIDRAFVNALFDVEHGEVIAETIIALAQRMRLQTVAEGVETQEQAFWLRAAGCSMMQGYLYGRPMGFDQLVEWARTQPPADWNQPHLRLA